MDYTSKTRSLQSLVKDMNKGTINLSHKLQRPEGQWNRKQRTDLIDSLLRHYPINPTYAIVEEDGTLSVIDGVQRLSTIRDYIENVFALSKDMDSVIINNEEKNLSGLKFEKLDEDTKSEILNAELQIYRMTQCTETDIREMFRRQNAGKPLNSKLLRIVKESDEFSDAIYSLANHPFMNKLMSPAQRKNGTDRDTIVQTFMLVATNQENDFTSFRAKDIDMFVSQYADQYINRADILKEAMNKFDESFDEIKIPVTSIPQILYSGYRIIKDKKSFTKLVDKVADFCVNYDSNDEYKQFVQNGTGSKENVRGRFDYWRSIVRELQ
jgi:hypothetical protein